jgi:hypothetical protein
MDRTKPEETEGTEEVAGAGPAGQAATDARVPASAARAMTTFSAADEEKQRGVRRMKLTATGLSLGREACQADCLH